MLKNSGFDASLIAMLDLMFLPQGATDSEKRVLCLSAENESLKQNLSLTQGLLQQLSAIPSQSSTMLIKVRRTSTAESAQMWAAVGNCKPKYILHNYCT